MVRSLFASAALALVGLATLVSAQSYADFEFGEGELTLGDPVTSIQVVIGTVDQVKTACNDIEDCIGVLYRKQIMRIECPAERSLADILYWGPSLSDNAEQSAGGGRLLRYDPNGSIQVGAGYSGISWRLVAILFHGR